MDRPMRVGDDLLEQGVGRGEDGHVARSSLNQCAQMLLHACGVGR